MRYFLRLSYDGTPFHGWQKQPNAISVQETLENALTTILQQRIEITGAGRTDTGVHAREMYAHFDYDGIIDEKKLLKSVNTVAGHHIAVHSVQRVRPDAHARFDATSRSYSYYISMRKDPFISNFSHRMYLLPDVGMMNRACEILLKTDDFTSFAKLHSDSKTNICKVTHAEWSYDNESEMLKFRITADRFLRNMVRAVVGTLLEVGLGKINLQDFQSIIDRKDRCGAGTSMPAKGLFLEKICYPEDIYEL